MACLFELIIGSYWSDQGAHGSFSVRCDRLEISAQNSTAVSKGERRDIIIAKEGCALRSTLALLVEAGKGVKREALLTVKRGCPSFVHNSTPYSTTISEKKLNSPILSRSHKGRFTDQKRR